MKLNELKNGELDNVVKMYIEHRKELYKLVSVEDFMESCIKRCEYCGELFVDDLFKTRCPECDEQLLEIEECEETQWEHNWNDGFNNFRGE